ncbi:MAG: hypothetical protein H6Q20_842 [Bacteroidetes bacterium]|jgi:hypothetical protein|nr:hypothetical protein [Bacteroidota bacterium]
MKTHNKTFIKALLTIVVAASAFTACKDEAALELPYLFRPINFNVSMNKTEATFSWAPVTDAVSYTFQVSTDSLDFSNPVVDVTSTDLSYKQEFAGETKFFARVKANASVEDKNSKFNQLSFTTPGENILITNQILVTAQKTVQIAWEAERKATRIEMEAEGGSAESFDITTDEATAGLKSCVVAGNNVKYTVRIYNGTVLRGTTTLKVEGDVFLSEGESLKTAIEAATGSLYVIMLKPGNYSLSSSSVCPSGTSLVIKGIDKTNRTKVNVQNNTVVLTLPAVADSIVMTNIDFTAVTASNTAYFINQSAASSVGKLMFDGCNLSGFGNNILRFQNATGVKRITNFIVNNAIVTNCGNGASAMPSNGTYAFVNSNIDNGYITNIKITNSTFNGVSHSLLNVPGASGSTTTNIVSAITIENSTFYNVLGGTTSVRYLIDGGGSSTVSIDITLKNLIFAKTMATNTPGGIRKSGGALNVEKVYITSDWSSAATIANSTAFNGSSTDLWNNPANGDFTLKDAAFAGKGVAGDLRWY